MRGLSADLSAETDRCVIVSSKRSNIVILLILMGHSSRNPLEIIHVTITMIYADVYLICPTQMYTGTRIIWAPCGLKYYICIAVRDVWFMMELIRVILEARSSRNRVYQKVFASSTLGRCTTWQTFRPTSIRLCGIIKNNDNIPSIFIDWTGRRDEGWNRFEVRKMRIHLGK